MGSRWQKVGGVEPPPDMDRIAADVIARHAATLERLALCEAFESGARWLQDLEMGSYEVARNAWRPGCGRAWGG